jgi:hypothetical protein
MMSLKLWLPFTKDLLNYGTESSNITATNVTANTNGKLGGCYYFNGSSYLIGTHNFLTNDISDWSFACWMKLATTSGTQTLFSCRTASDQRGITVFHSGANMALDDGVRWQFTPTTTIAANTWYHVCFVRKKGIGKYLYINGVLDSSTTTTGTPTIINTSRYAIGSSQNSATTVSGNLLNGYLNDIRFYDHALSVAEIKELAKGLVVHYKLDNTDGMENANLVSNSKRYEGWSAGSGWTKVTTDTNSIGYRFTRTGATSNNWVRLIPTLQVDGNNYANGITVSLDLLTPDKSAINQKCIGSLQTYQSNNTRIGWVEPSWDLSNVVDNKWSRIKYTFSKTQLLNNNTSGATYAYTKFSFQLVQNGDITIRNIKIENGNKATAYIPNSADNEYAVLGYNSATVVDSSGHGYNATKSGTLTISTNTPRYELSTAFAASSHITTPTLTVSGFANTYTFSWWAKYTNYSDHMMWGFSDGNRLNLYMSGGNFYWNTGDGNNNPFNVSAETYGDGNWHHFAVTGNGTAAKLYIDGTFKANAKTYKGITGTIIYMNGWDSSSRYNFNGQLSDFRLYATALSAADVLELYNVGARIADTGIMMGRELKEV